MDLTTKASSTDSGCSGGGAAVKYDGNAHEFLLGSEALRIKNACLFDSMSALYTSDVTPLPHQIYAVYHKMLPRLPHLRYLLADDPGAGKTIMAGLLIKEALARKLLCRVLIVCPGGLALQWQEEMQNRFTLTFAILDASSISSLQRAPMQDEQNSAPESCSTSADISALNENADNEARELYIGRLDVLSRSTRAMHALEGVQWDLVIVDEAHKMSASLFGQKASYTKRYRLGEVLSRNTQNLLLMTATPHNGKDEDYKMFIALLDHDRYMGLAHIQNKSIDTQDIMLRRVKEDLRRLDGTPLFPDRVAHTLKYPLSDEEQSLYDAVTDYVRCGMGRAERLDKNKRNTIGFALMVLQRRLASSPLAIYRSLRRRREKLEDALSKLQSGGSVKQDDMLGLYQTAIDNDDYATSGTEEAEDTISSMATSSSTIGEYKDEIDKLRLLEKQAQKLSRGKNDRKWDELSITLQNNMDMFEHGGREKLIIFTEHRDTLEYLEGKINSLLSTAGEKAVVIHGGLTREKRVEAVKTFRHDEKAHIMVATDAAGEGVNLQCAHLMINYDLPWNPNRLEQRFGRIHRIGQDKTCRLWNMAAEGTREGEVFSRLLEKLEAERKSLGGKVFDVLGSLRFDGKSLGDLLKEAIEEDDSGRHTAIDKIDRWAAQGEIRKLIEQSALDSQQFDAKDACAIADEMCREGAARMQPYYIEQFFLKAFKEAGGRIASRGGDSARLYQIIHVSESIKKHNAKLMSRYNRVCFDRAGVNMPGGKKALLIALGSPLLNALADDAIERDSGALERGVLLADEGDEIRRLFITQDTVTDAMGRTVARRMHFIEMKEDGTFIDAHKNPCVDCRPLEDSKVRIAKEILQRLPYLMQDDTEVMQYCQGTTSPMLLEEQTDRMLPLLEREERDVNSSFFCLISDASAGMYDTDAMGSEGAQATINVQELCRQRDERLKEIRARSNMHSLPPAILGRAIIIPSSMLRYATGEEAITRYAADSKERKRIENIAMQAVMEREKEAGFTPRDVSKGNLGYDIESLTSPSGGIKRLIEVKGIAAAKDEVTITRNEVNTSLTVRDNEGCYILAVVKVGVAALHLTYIRFPFENRLDKSANHADYDIKKLFQGDVILDVPLNGCGNSIS